MQRPASSTQILSGVVGLGSRRIPILSKESNSQAEASFGYTPGAAEAPSRGRGAASDRRSDSSGGSSGSSSGSSGGSGSGSGGNSSSSCG